MGSDEQLREDVLRGATEPPGTGELLHEKRTGIFSCAGCGQELFSSEHKYESGSGWPSFFTTLAEDRVELREDNSHGLARTEAVCAACGGHLGHVFEDGPKPTKERYCINSAALRFQPSTR